MSNVVLATHGLTKRFGSHLAVDDVSITVRDGDIYGFLGPNGAGKTTTLRMVLGLIHPSAGHVELFGQCLNLAPRTILREVGSLIEGPGFYPQLTARENLRIIQLLKGRGSPREIDELLGLVGLGAVGSQPVGTFSLGMKQRLAIAMALLGRPRLLVLDEPTNGLDPAGMREIRDLLRSLVRERGLTVLLSSHLLHEVQQIATRVGVIGSGRLLIEAPVDELRRRGSGSIEVVVSRPESAAALLEARFGVEVTYHDDGQLVVTGAVQPSEVNALLVRNNIQVSRLVERELTLEEVFFDLTGGVVRA